MKTKKEILKWWEERGEITKDVNDYKDFWDKIEKNKVVIMEKVKGEGEKQEHTIVIMRDNWQYPVRLLFYNLECYKIIDF